MTVKFVIHGRLPDLNEYIRTERGNRYAAANLKKGVQQKIMAECRLQHPDVKFTGPVTMHYLWIETDRRRDCDNIAFAKKFIQDAFVGAGILPDDSRKYVLGFSDDFDVDKGNPRVEVTIKEAKP